MQALIRPLNELAEFEEISRDIRKGAGMIRVCGCVNSQKTHMMYALSDGCNYRVIACSRQNKSMKSIDSWIRIPSCIRPKTCSFTRQT